MVDNKSDRESSDKSKMCDAIESEEDVSDAQIESKKNSDENKKTKPTQKE